MLRGQSRQGGEGPKRGVKGRDSLKLGSSTSASWSPAESQLDTRRIANRKFSAIITAGRLVIGVIWKEGSKTLKDTKEARKRLGATPKGGFWSAPEKARKKKRFRRVRAPNQKGAVPERVSERRGGGRGKSVDDGAEAH